MTKCGWICRILTLIGLAQCQGLFGAVAPQMPVAFIQNVGQTDANVRFLGTGPKFHAMFFDRSITVQTGAARMNVQFRGASAAVLVTGSQPTGAVANYISGNDRRDWKTGLPMQGEVLYSGLWPGVNLRYRGDGGSLKAEYLVKAGAEIGEIQISYSGNVSIENDGSLLVRGERGDYREEHPVLYQVSAGRNVAVTGGFRMINRNTVGFWAGSFDHSLELVVDPVITYSTFFGGSSQDSVNGVGFDANLNTYIAGFTSSSDLPVVNPVKQRGGGVDAFVAKFGVGTGKLVYCTFLGGSGDDRAFGIAVNPAGEAFVTGWTSSTNFPVQNAIQSHLGGSRSAFVTKLNASGSALLYSTYFGGAGVTVGNSIAIDPAGEAAIGGDTTSSGLGGSGTFQNTLKGGQDGFILKLQPSGAKSVFAYYGGSNNDHIASISLDIYGSIAIGGSTFSNDIPTVSAYQASNATGQTGFLAYMPGNAAFLFCSTYFGGSFGSSTHPEGVTAVAIDTNSTVSSVYVAGVTSSPDFPVTAGAYQTTFAGGSDGYVARFTAVGGLLASTLLGGSALDGVNALALDFYGNPHIAGYTASLDFPVARPVQASNRGQRDAFVAKFDKTLDKLLYSTYLGGSSADAANAIAVDAMCTAIVGGQTGSAEFPLVKAEQTAKTAALTGFTTKITPGWTAVWFYHGLWFIDSSHSRGSDGTSFAGTVWGFGQTGDIPIVGDWNGSGKKKIGIFRNGTWILDSNNNGQIDSGDRTFTFGQAGDFPVVGDWDGSGQLKAGLFRNGTFILDYSGHLTGTYTGKADVTFSFGQSGDIPVVGDWNGSGTAKVGIFRSGQWLVNYPGDQTTITTYNYGAGGDFPLTGDWDGSGATKIGIFRNPAWCFDYDGDHVLGNPGFTELIFWYGISGAWPLIM